jgi:hypothetical protein
MNKPQPPDIPSEYMDMIERNCTKHVPGKYIILWFEYTEALDKYNREEVRQKQLEYIKLKRRDMI